MRQTELMAIPAASLKRLMATMDAMCWPMKWPGRCLIIDGFLVDKAHRWVSEARRPMDDATIQPRDPKMSPKMHCTALISVLTTQIRHRTLSERQWQPQNWAHDSPIPGAGQRRKQDLVELWREERLRSTSEASANEQYWS